MFDNKNFNYTNFIEYVMKKMHLEDSTEPTKTKIEKEIARLLGDRIITSVMHAMTDDNLSMYETIKRDHPYMSDFDALYSMVEEVPALSEVMIKSINDLAEELTYDSERLDMAIEKRRERQKSKKR